MIESGADNGDEVLSVVTQTVDTVHDKLGNILNSYQLSHTDITFLESIITQLICLNMNTFNMLIFRVER